jgi:hypothetical protein
MNRLEFERAINHERRQFARLPGKGSGRHTLQLSQASFTEAVRKHGPAIASTEAGWRELHEQARFNGLVDAGRAPGRRNRHGRVTWSKGYGK